MQTDEPPSPRGRKALNYTRRVRVFLNSTSRRHPAFVSAASVATLSALLAVSLSTAIHLKNRPQAAGDAERVAFTLSNYIQLDTLQPAGVATDFSSVAFAGQNVGGLPNNEAALRQRVVQPGDTLGSIAAEYGLHTGTIVLANADMIDDTELIHPGQVLFIPDTDASADDLANEYNQRQQKLSSKKAVTKKSAASVASTSSDTGSARLKLLQPLAYYTYVSQPFNALVHPGKDYATSPGTPVYAVADGCVVLASRGYNGGYGNTIILDLGGGYTVRDAHLSVIEKGVVPGACFSSGDVIGYSGNTGRSTGPHLHFEVRLNGVPKDPSNYGI